MEIYIAIFAFVLNLITAYGFIYSCDEVQILGARNEHDDFDEYYENKTLLEQLHMPKLSDLQSNTDIYSLQKYVDNEIIPAVKYFSLRNEINALQRDCDNVFLYGIILQFFSICLCSTMLFKAEVFDSFLTSLVTVTVVCLVLFFLIDFIYRHFHKSPNLKGHHFNFHNMYYYKESAEHSTRLSYENALNNILIDAHYEYLCNVKETIIHRHFIRQILYKMSIIIYLLFFLALPEN